MGRKHYVGLALAMALAAGVGIATYPTQPAGTLVYAFLADAGEVAPITDLCDVAADGGMLAGNYTCLRGNGTQTGATLTATGSPTTVTKPTCGNGAYCADTSSQRLNGTTQFFATANQASPTGSFTVCSVVEPESLSGNSYFVEKTTTLNVFALSTVGATGSFVVWKNNTTATSITAGTLAVRVRNFVCGRYTYVADGSSLLKMFVNGSSVGTPSTTAVGPPTVQSSPILLGKRGGTNAIAYVGLIGNAFYTETALSDAQIVALTDAALGSAITPSIGAVPTFTRTTVSYCPTATESTAQFLTVNRACFTQGKYVARRQTANRILQSETLDNATWTKISDGVTAAPTVTANTTDVLDPYGTNTAEKVVYPAVSGANAYSLVNQTFTGTAFAAAAAIWGRTASGTATLYQGFNISTPTYYSTACTFTTTWSRCHLDQKLLTAAAWNYTLGVDLRDGAQASQSAQTVYLWGAAVETSSGSVSQYATTTTSTVTSTNDSMLVADPLTGTPVAACVSANVQSFDTDGAWSDPGNGTSGGQLVSFGDLNTANSAQCFIRRDAAVNSFRSNLYDNTATLAGTFSATGSVTTGTHNLRCVYSPGPSALYIDGVNTDYSLTGSGRVSLFTAWPSTMAISTVSNSGRPLHGYLWNIRVGNGTTACN